MKITSASIVCALCLMSSACMVGPKYARPTTPVTPEFKEAGPESFKEMKGWKTPQPSDQAISGT